MSLCSSYSPSHRKFPFFIGSFSHTADFIEKVLGVYTRSMETIYLSLSAQVVVSTFFMKSPVCMYVSGSKSLFHNSLLFSVYIHVHWKTVGNFQTDYQEVKCKSTNWHTLTWHWREIERGHYSFRIYSFGLWFHAPLL